MAASTMPAKVILETFEHTAAVKFWAFPKPFLTLTRMIKSIPMQQSWNQETWWPTTLEQFIGLALIAVIEQGRG